MAHYSHGCILPLHDSKQTRFPVSGVMDFYGCSDLAGSMASALWQPSLHYQHLMPAIPPRTARSLRGTQVLNSAPVDRRFALYAYARQTGQWGELQGISRSDASRFSLDAATQKALPPSSLPQARQTAMCRSSAPRH